MTPQVTLFVMRLISAILLLAFVFIVFWHLRMDLKAIRTFSTNQAGGLGVLRVIANGTAEPVIGTGFELSPLTTIGRNSRNSVVLNDNFVSGNHALLSWRDTQWWIEDLGSRNGTKLNDVDLTDPVIISPGDVITIGELQFKLELSGKSEEGKSSGIRDSNP